MPPLMMAANTGRLTRMDLHGIADTLTAVRSILGAMDWAEDEIASAQRRHPDAADRIWSAFRLLQTTSDLMASSEVLYRAHARELIGRVVRGEDTRPGTAAEGVAVMREASLAAPLTAAGFGLYARLWKLAELPGNALTHDLPHYEAIRGAEIDNEEALLRHKLRQDWRALPAEKGTANRLKASAVA